MKSQSESPLDSSRAAKATDAPALSESRAAAATGHFEAPGRALPSDSLTPSARAYLQRQSLIGMRRAWQSVQRRSSFIDKFVSDEELEAVFRGHGR